MWRVMENSLLWEEIFFFKNKHWHFKDLNILNGMTIQMQN